MIPFPGEIGLAVGDSLLATGCQTRHVFFPFEWKHNKPAFYPAKQSYSMTICASILKPACTKPTASATDLNVAPYQFVSLNVCKRQSGWHSEGPGPKINKGLTNPEERGFTDTYVEQQRCISLGKTTYSHTNTHTLAQTLTHAHTLTHSHMLSKCWLQLYTQ